MLQLICKTITATQTLQGVTRKAREEVVNNQLDISDEMQKEILVNKEKAFFIFLDREDHSFDKDRFDDSTAYADFLYLEFKQNFWNHLHSIIFWANVYQAFMQQKDYLLNKLVKPFGVTEEAAFWRIDMIANLMEFFPPPHSCEGSASQAHWNNFKEVKKLSQDLKQEMKYNLLPEFFHNQFEDMEGVWTEWTDNKFLAQAQKAEADDAKERRCSAE